MPKIVDWVERDNTLLAVLDLIGLPISTAQVSKYCQYFNYSVSDATCYKRLVQLREQGRVMSITREGNLFWCLPTPINREMRNGDKTRE